MTNDELLATLAQIALDSSQELKRGGNAAMLDLLLVGHACNEAYLKLRDTHGAVREGRKRNYVEETVIYRGSGTDLATDLCAIVPPEKLQLMVDALVETGHVKLRLPTGEVASFADAADPYTQRGRDGAKPHPPIVDVPREVGKTRGGVPVMAGEGANAAAVVVAANEHEAHMTASAAVVDRHRHRSDGLSDAARERIYEGRLPNAEYTFASGDPLTADVVLDPCVVGLGPTPSESPVDLMRRAPKIATITTSVKGEYYANLTDGSRVQLTTAQAMVLTADGTTDTPKPSDAFDLMRAITARVRKARCGAEIRTSIEVAGKRAAFYMDIEHAPMLDVYDPAPIYLIDRIVARARAACLKETPCPRP